MAEVRPEATRAVGYAQQRRERGRGEGRSGSAFDRNHNADDRRAVSIELVSSMRGEAAAGG